MSNFNYELCNKIFQELELLRKTNPVSAIEVMTILECNCIPSEAFYKLNRPIVVLRNEKTWDYEIIYKRLEQDTLDFVERNICSVKMTKVDSVEDWVEQNVKTGKIHFGLTVDEMEGKVRSCQI